MSVTAFIPARCGSKAIHLKNIRPFCGRPLLYWCLKALEDASSVDQIVVATDCQEIESCVLDFGLSKVEIFRRQPANARDQSATEDVILEYLNQNTSPSRHLLLLVQATSPFTTSDDFNTAISQYHTSGVDSLLSCALFKRFLWDRAGKPINYTYQKRPRRQEFHGTLLENGAFYLNTMKNIQQFGNRLSGKIGIYEMPAYTSLELDEEDDWFQGEYLMHKYRLANGPRNVIKLFLSDVDGVLTDAGMYYSEQGDELKKFNTYDGMGFQLLQQRQVKVGILTKEDRQLNRRRAKKLGLDFDFHGVQNKLELVSDLCNDLKITLQEVAYIGDDINDLQLLKAVGVAACPLNALPAIKRIPGIIQLQRSGGNGAVREFVEQFLLS